MSYMYGSFLFDTLGAAKKSIAGEWLTAQGLEPIPKNFTWGDAEKVAAQMNEMGVAPQYMPGDSDVEMEWIGDDIWETWVSLRKEEIQDMIEENLTTDHLAEYYLADHGYRIGIYADGSIRVGPDVGNEIAEDERPVADLKCPGMANLDMGVFREGWECEEYNDEYVIREVCENGCMEDHIEQVITSMIENWEFCQST